MPRSYTVAILLAALCCGGCLEPSYEALSPADGMEYGHDVIGRSRTPGMRYWVRGRITGDLDGERGADGYRLHEEEALLVTLESDDPQRRGPITEAWIVICRTDTTRGVRNVLARELVYAADGAAGPGVVTPDTLAPPPGRGRVEDGRIEMSDVNGDGAHEIFVLLWREINDGFDVIHHGYTYAEGGPRHMLGVRLVQRTPGAERRDIDRDGDVEVALKARILPSRGETDTPGRPEWPCVFELSGEVYRQGNANYPSAYDDTLMALYEDRALTTPPTPEHDRRIGLIYRYRGDDAMAARFLAAAPTPAPATGKRPATRDADVIDQPPRAQVLPPRDPGGPELPMGDLFND